MIQPPLLDVRNLDVRFSTPEGTIHALSSFSLTLRRGETVAVVGESGCGKSVAAHAILRILPSSAGISGDVFLSGVSLSSVSESEMNTIRGEKIAILFQNPDRSLNPLYRIGRQISEPRKAHNLPADQDMAEFLLSRAGFPVPGDVIGKYPCQCSGGMNQRSLLAVVSSLDPLIFIADEPTKGLDQSRIADVAGSLAEIRTKNRGLLLITHDLSLASDLSDRILVMYSGEVVESGDTGDILGNPCHPYTRALLMSQPQNGFVPIPGMSPALSALPAGCRFAPRCSHALPVCHHDHPDMIPGSGREVRCLRLS